MGAYKRDTSSKASICIDCVRAVGGESGCSWSNGFIPEEGCEFEIVPYGYLAESGRETYDRRGHCDITYRITKCPKFERDEPRDINKAIKMLWGKE